MLSFDHARGMKYRILQKQTYLDAKNKQGGEN
jgi:hypothetical protein